VLLLMLRDDDDDDDNWASSTITKSLQSCQKLITPQVEKQESQLS